MPLFKGTVLQFLLMDKRDQAKLIQWQENNSYLQKMFIKAIKDKVLFLEQFSSYGRK
jgi:hypothetical protein